MKRCYLLVFVLLCLTVPAMGEPAPLPMGSAALLCRPAIQAAERAHGVPHGLMAAIGRVESGRRDPASGVSNPWPWTVNAQGQGSFYDTKAQAVGAVRSMQARGIRSIDVGCMQVNLMHHPNAFASLDAAFDPTVNADYAGRFLTDLFNDAHAWPTAAGRYHSATPDLAADYQRKVMALWPEEQGAPVIAGISPLQRAWSATMNLTAPFRRPEGFHIIPKATLPGLAATPGRGLDFYRARPVAVAARWPVRAGG